MKIMRTMLVIVLAVCVLSASALAAAKNISVTDAAYYPNRSLKSISCVFDWPSNLAGAPQRLVLMTERLRSGYEPGVNSSYGDFTDRGTYGSSFSDFEKAVAYDSANNTFGIVSCSDEQNVVSGSTGNRRVFNFNDTDIPLNVDDTYYIYLWTYYGGHYYPDNLFCAIRVEDGVVKYTEATGRNSFDEGSFTEIEGEEVPPLPSEDGDEPENVPVPKTGDGANIALWAGMLVFSMAVMIFGKKRFFE